MKKENRITSKRFKMMVGICAVLMGLTVIMSGMIKGTLGSVNEAAILYFENLDTICEIYVNAGTAQEDLGLPPSLRAIIKTVSDDPADNEFESGGIINESENGIEIEGDEIADEKGFRQTEPRIGDDGEYNYGRHGYIAPENEYYLRETDQLVIYTIYYADGSKAYRVHGSYGGNNEGFYACSEYGNIIGIISDIPVTWEGEYDGSVPGTYILTARAANFDYSGVMPVAVIKVAQEETKEPDTEPAPVPYENSEEPPEAEETDDYATPESGRISGFLRTDFGDDGFYNEEIQPLANYTVYLYASDDLTIPVDEIQTAVDGTYEFSGLEPGGYVLGLASEASETVNDGEYLLPDTVTDDNKFAIDYESDPLMAYTEIIELDEGMAVEDINAGLMLSISLLRASPDEYTIDLSTVTNNSKGTGWTCSDITAANSGTAGKINFNKDASGNKYTIVKSVTGNAITRDIIINPDVSDITVTYVGDNIQMNKVGTPNVYYPFNSTVTINGGGNNSVVYEKVVNINRGTVNIESGAGNTTVTYKGVNHRDTQTTDRDDSTFEINNNGENTAVIYENVDMRRAIFNHNSGTAEVRPRGANTFENIINKTIRTSFETTVADYANLKLMLSGSGTVSNGYITVKEKAVLTIDSADLSGSEYGYMSITYNETHKAVIGSDGLANSGDIIINGGTLAVNNANTAATSGGAGIGGGNGKTGTVVINGGIVGVKVGGGGGAGIGGGYGMNGAGNVTINGGIIDVKVSGGGGAGIGGGNSGTGSVTINNGIITATMEQYAQGAAIGGGIAGKGIVSVHSGEIKALSRYGAAIGGGSASTGNPPGIAEVTVYGGYLDLRSDYGACIGNGGYIDNISGGTSGIDGFVKITGGTVLADFAGGNAIGTGKNNKKYPKVIIDVGADIAGFGRAISNFPGIDTGDFWENEGNGYFVNCNFDTEPLGIKGTLVVYEKDNPVPVRVAYSPGDFYVFSFTTGSASPGTYYAYTGTNSGALRQVICKGAPAGKLKHDEAEILSVKRPYVYYENGHTTAQYFRSMSVTYGEGGSYADKIPVNEYYVDMSGNKLKDIFPNPSATLVSPGGTYAKTDIPPSADYTYKGYKWTTPPDGSETGIIPGNPNEQNITKEKTIYFVYAEAVDVDVTVSKKVDGSFSDKTKSFSFTVYIPDKAGNTVNCEGNGAPEGGILAFDANGEAAFKLKHGEYVTFKNISSKYTIQITETEDANYTVSFLDDLEEHSIKRNYTDLTKVGVKNRAFDFINTRKTVVPTGIIGESWGMEICLLLVIPAILSGFAAVIKLVRKRMVSYAK